MNREIKFRAWDKEAKKLYYFEFSDMQGSFNCVANTDIKNLEVTQYTGLKDKNGKEIYEGDIVKINTWFTHGEEENRVVVYSDAGFMPFMGYNDYEVGGGESEVIGNIYENSELLKN